MAVSFWTAWLKKKEISSASNVVSRKKIRKQPLLHKVFLSRLLFFAPCPLCFDVDTGVDRTREGTYIEVPCQRANGYQPLCVFCVIFFRFVPWFFVGYWCANPMASVLHALGIQHVAGGDQRQKPCCTVGAPPCVQAKKIVYTGSHGCMRHRCLRSL